MVCEISKHTRDKSAHADTQNVNFPIAAQCYVPGHQGIGPTQSLGLHVPCALALTGPEYTWVVSGRHRKLQAPSETCVLEGRCRHSDQLRYTGAHTCARCCPLRLLSATQTKAPVVLLPCVVLGMLTPADMMTQTTCPHLAQKHPGHMAATVQSGCATLRGPGHL